MNTEIKQYDVFSFYDKSRDSNHCWDGQLVACKRENGDIYLADTYWASKYDKFQRGGERKYYTPTEATNRGELKLICNLEDVEEIKEGDTYYYDESDIFNLSYQHNCYKFFVKKIGAVKSQNRMIEYAQYKLDEAIQKKASVEHSIKRLADIIDKIRNGDTTTTIY